MAENRSRRISLFKGLTRLFSGPIMSYRSQSGRPLRQQYFDRYSNVYRSVSGQNFKRATYNPFGGFSAEAMTNQRRLERYIEYREMEVEPILASALDIYADEMTNFSDLRPVLNIKSTNEEIKSVLTNLFKNILSVENNLREWCRNTCKYGDYFLYLDVDETLGITGVFYLPETEIERMEGEDMTNPNYVQYQWNARGLTFESWQVAHFRLSGNDQHKPYGTSVLDPARRSWRQYDLMKNHMIAYRVVRSAEKRVFYIDVGQVRPQDVEPFLERVKDSMKRNTIVDQDNGRVDLRYNPLGVEEDIFVAVRGNTNATRIETLPAGNLTTAVDDVELIKDDLFTAIKIPPSYISRNKDASEDKTTLAQKDVRFARTIKTKQADVVEALTKIARVHLYVLGFRHDDLTSFRLSLNNPSTISELQELELLKAKSETASGLAENFFSRRWIAEHVFDLSEEEFLRCRREIFSDKKYDADLETTIALAGGGGGELGGDLDLGDELGDELGLDDLGGEEGAAEEDDDMLLATPPGYRPSPGTRMRKQEPTAKSTQSQAKGKIYNPVAASRNGAEARKRSYAGLAKKEMGTTRATLPGLEGITSLSRGVFAELGSNYNRDEFHMHDIGKSTKKLLESLNLEPQSESIEDEEIET
mgnify:CR=1 FL=1